MTISFRKKLSFMFGSATGNKTLYSKVMTGECDDVIEILDNAPIKYTEYMWFEAKPVKKVDDCYKLYYCWHRDYKQTPPDYNRKNSGKNSQARQRGIGLDFNYTLEEVQAIVNDAYENYAVYFGNRLTYQNPPFAKEQPFAKRQLPDWTSPEKIAQEKEKQLNLAKEKLDDHIDNGMPTLQDIKPVTKPTFKALAK